MHIPFPLTHNLPASTHEVQEYIEPALNRLSWTRLQIIVTKISFIDSLNFIFRNVSNGLATFLMNVIK